MNFIHFVRRGSALALLAALFSAGASRPARADVPNVFFNPNNGHYYKFVSGAGNWIQADTGAKALGGYLAALSTQTELQWVLANISTGSVSVHIGGSDNGSEGAWYWTGSEPWTWSNWRSGEPNNVNTENYLMMYTDGTWNDEQGTNSNPGYIVEWVTNPNAPPPPVAPAAPSGLTASLTFQSTILLGWTDNSTNESTYQIERMPAGGAFGALATLGVNAVAHEDTVLAPLTAYTYRVRAVNSVGPSAWSNEATAVSGQFAPTTPAPSDLVVVDVTTGTADLQWTDRSNGETGFEVHRRRGSAAFAFLYKTAPDAVSFHDSGLLPDAGYDYAVRSVGTIGASGFVEVSVTTDPTLVVASVKGDLKDSAKFGRDSLKATAGWSTIEGVSDGAANPVTEGITVRAGSAGALVVLSLPPNAEGWKGKGAKWKWKNPAGSATKYQVQVDLDRRLVSVSAAGVELAAPPANPVQVSIAIGNDGGTETRDWAVQKKPGTLKLR